MRAINTNSVLRSWRKLRPLERPELILQVLFQDLIKQEKTTQNDADVGEQKRKMQSIFHGPTFVSGRMSLARWWTAILVILLWHVLEGLKKKCKHWKCHAVLKACMKRYRAVFQHTVYKSFSNCCLITAAVVWFLKLKRLSLVCYQRRKLTR